MRKGKRHLNRLERDDSIFALLPQQIVTSRGEGGRRRGKAIELADGEAADACQSLMAMSDGRRIESEMESPHNRGWYSVWNKGCGKRSA